MIIVGHKGSNKANRSTFLQLQLLHLDALKCLHAAAQVPVQMSNY